MSEPKVVFEAVPSRWVIEYQNPGQDWEFIERKPTLEAAKEYAQQSMDYASADSAVLWRVVDTRPDKAQPVYTVEALRGDNGAWNQIMPATTSSEAYAYAKQCAEDARSAGENNLRYRVVQMDADGAKIAQEVTPDGLGDLNPLNLLWIEKMEREDAARVIDPTVGTSSACAYLSDEDAPLPMDTYQQQAKATAVYPYEKADQYLIAGLAGEVGEVASLFAKHWRADQEWLDYSEVAAELGDVLWFITMLADEVGYDLTEVAQNNLDKLADRAVRGKLKGNGDNR